MRNYTCPKCGRIGKDIEVEVWDTRDDCINDYVAQYWCVCGYCGPIERQEVSFGGLEKARKILSLYYTSDNQILKRGTAHSAGIDIPTTHDGQVLPNQTVLFGTGVKVEIPQDYCGRLLARSSVRKHGIIIDGVIDSDYRGEVKIGVTNCSNTTYIINSNKPIAQLLIMPVLMCDVVRVERLSETERGEGGFGSTDGENNEN